MKATGVDLIVVVALRFTDAELRVMARCSDLHYDYKCRAATLPDGAISRMISFHANTAPAGKGYRLEWDDLDTLTKICEMGLAASAAVGNEDAKVATGLMFAFKRILERMSAVREGVEKACTVAVGIINETIENPQRSV